MLLEVGDARLEPDVLHAPQLCLDARNLSGDRSGARILEGGGAERLYWAAEVGSVRDLLIECE